jgi:AraC-like DNA-binding protein
MVTQATLPPGARRIRRGYVRFVLMAARRAGVDADAALAGTGVTVAAIEAEGSHWLPFEALYRLASALPGGGGGGIGLEIGDLSPITVHGPLAVAVSASRSLGEALATLAEMGGGPARTMRFHFEVVGAFGDLTMTPEVELDHLRHFFLESNVALVNRALEATVGQQVEGLEFHFPYPAPAWSELYRRRLPGAVAFNADALRIRVPRSQLALRSFTADPRAREAALRDCRREVDELDAAASGDLVPAIRNRLAQVDGDYPDLAAVARSLGLSTRTLIRRLRDKGVRYRQLVDDARVEAACWRLTHTDDTVEQIAADLGYVDTSNFSRTFRRWRGTTPTEFRGRPRA